MAVYTELNQQAIQGILNSYAMGDLIKFEPISAGIENTNYFIWTSEENHKSEVHKEWVLTIFENLNEQALPFYNQLTAYLKEQGFHVPAPVLNKYGQDVFYIQSNVASKFGVIVPKFKGVALNRPTESECWLIGKYIAEMHSSLIDCPLSRKIQLSREVEHTTSWCTGLVESLKPKVVKQDQELLDLALARYLDYDEVIKQCPNGIVHGDLFRDNVLFENQAVSGVIDFYHAGKTALLFDLAIVANDWTVNFDCLPSVFSEESQSIPSSDLLDVMYNEAKLTSLLNAYESIRPLSELEKQVWPSLLELAAFRFWLSRLKTKYLEGYQNDVKKGDVVKSPLGMKLILLAAMNRVSEQQAN